MLKKTTVLSLALLVFAICLPALATDISGPLTGTLPLSGSPYQVIGDIYVPIAGLLAIEPGVVFDFQGNFKFRVSQSAALYAFGTESDSIVFTCDTLAYPAKWGGVVFDTFTASSNMQYCIVEHSNDAGIRCIWSSPIITHCAIRYNGCTGPSGLLGAGIICEYGSNPEISFCVITRNTSPTRGGGIRIHENSSPDIIGNIISHNIEYAYSGTGGGISATNNCHPRITDNIISNNTAGYGGGISLWNGSSCLVEGNLIASNFANVAGGGIELYGTTDVIIRGNTIKSNSTDIGWSLTGGGMIVTWNSAAVLEANTVIDNISWACGGISVTEMSQVTLLNNTIAGNRDSQDYYYGLYADSISAIDLTNCIVWDNRALGNVTAVYSDIQGGLPGEGNIDTDPFFRDADGGDYHLKAVQCGSLFDSPCIDAGSIRYRDDSLSCDRGLGTTDSDMGAYGGGYVKCIYTPGDINNNGRANGIDVVYAINYFGVGGGPPPVIVCECGPSQHLYPAGDVNGNCVFNGIDITFFVNYLKNYTPQLLFCPTCPSEE